MQCDATAAGRYRDVRHPPGGARSGRYGRQIHGRAGQPGRAGTGCSAGRGFVGHGCCPRRLLVPMIGYARPLLVWWVQEVRGQFCDDWELPRRRRRAGSLDLVASSPCACRKTRPTFSTVRERPPAVLPLVPHRYCGCRFSRTRGFSVAMRSPSATLSSGSSQKNARTQLL